MSIPPFFAVDFIRQLAKKILIAEFADKRLWLLLHRLKLLLLNWNAAKISESGRNNY